jgi:hypothetical protein
MANPIDDVHVLSDGNQPTPETIAAALNSVMRFMVLRGTPPADVAMAAAGATVEFVRKTWGNEVTAKWLRQLADGAQQDLQTTPTSDQLCTAAPAGHA